MPGVPGHAGRPLVRGGRAVVRLREAVQGVPVGQQRAAGGQLRFQGAPPGQGEVPGGRAGRQGGQFVQAPLDAGVALAQGL